MKILTVISSLDFPNHPRKSTLSAIHRLNPGMDVLMYNSIRNYFVPKNTEAGIKFYFYHFWILGKLRKYSVFPAIEHFLRGKHWKSFFKNYTHIFFIDPNQYYLLPYLNRRHKLVYLLRDPVILQNPVNYHFELPLIKRADAILAISENLQNRYLSKHYGYQPENVFLWSNAVDLEIWDYEKYSSPRHKGAPVVGMAGNINRRTDLGLLKFLLGVCPDVRFEVAGKLNLDAERMKAWDELSDSENFHYHGYIPFAELPGLVAGWDIGLLLESKDTEYSTYFNHNKIYQYMALGKPFVSYDYNESIARYENAGFIGNSPLNYSEMLHLALEKSGLPGTINHCLTYAKENSAEKRAVEFLEILTTMQ